MNALLPDENLNGSILERFASACRLESMMMSNMPSLMNTPVFEELKVRAYAHNIAYISGNRNETDIELYITAVLDLASIWRERSTAETSVTNG